MNRRPELSDYYDASDPRGCSSSEYREYEADLIKWVRDRVEAENDVTPEEGIDEDDDSYSPYCKICTSCGETGCCSPIACEQHPDGKYCDGNLNELKFGYLMFRDMYELISDLNNEELDAKLDKLYDENWDLIFGTNKIEEPTSDKNRE